MSAFLYFRNDAEPWDWLEDRFSDGSVMSAVTADKSPSGEPGFLFRQRDTALPGLVDWHRFRDGQYVGWIPGNPPGPTDLDRGLSLPTLEIKLRDGNTWKYPRVLAERGIDPDRGNGLPEVLTVAGIDSPSERPYAVLVARAESIRDRLTNVVTDLDPPTLAELVEYAASLLSVHYHIGLAEILALGLLEHTSIDQMILASIDGLETLRVAAFEVTGQLLEI